MQQCQRQSQQHACQGEPVEDPAAHAGALARNRAQLKRIGWEVLTLWECQLNKEEQLRARLVKFLGERTENHG
jgi:hypothetical protein